MSSVTLRPMTVEEFDAWVPGAIEEYANDHIRAGSRPADTALESSKKEFAKLLPDGVATVGHHLLIAEDGADYVGLLWLNIPEGEPVPRVFVYNVVVDESQRGKGYGRAIMLAAEPYARQHGADTIRLHVFGDNTVARGLYESLVYVATNINMAKPL